MPRNVSSGVPSLTALIFVLLVSGPVDAGVRTRTLPDLPERVEAVLRERALASGAERVHALVEVPRGARRSTERTGVRLLRSAGGDLWLASVPREIVLSPDAAAPTRMWNLGPGDRVAPGFPQRVADLRPEEPVALRIKVFRDEPADGVRALVAELNGTVQLSAPRLGVLDVTVPAGSLSRFSGRDDVRWIEPAPPAPVDANNNLRFDAEVNAVQNTLGIDGAGVLLGMWDSGVPDTTHPDLVGRVTGAESGMTTFPHSTHVSGVALGDGSNSPVHGGTGTQWRGVATAATMVSYTSVGAIAEVDSAISIHDIDLSTNSWVYPVSTAAGTCSLYGDYGTDAPEFDDIVRGIYGKAVPVVFAAGNERDDGDCSLAATGGFSSLPPPGTAKNILTVGAHFSDQQYMTPFSSWGPTDDGRMKPDLSAPGCQQFGDFGVTSTAIGGGYVSMCGTSQAAPAVSGSIAALLQEWRARFPGDPRPATYKVLLGAYAKDRANAGPDYRFGLGALNLHASVTGLQTATTVEDAVDDLQMDSWPFFVPAGAGTLIVTLAWDDPAAAELASPTLVNDLDLELLAPTTGTWQAFVLDPANPDSLATRGANRRDNVEQVRVIGPEAGAWTARVTGFGVPQGPQDYSLAGFDDRAPADAAALAVTAAGDTTVALTWIRPGDTDRAGTLVTRSTSPIAWTPSDGTFYSPGTEPSPGVFVVASDDVDHQTVALADQPLAPGTLHHYALWAYDEVPNYSAGIADTATTTSLAVAAPLVQAEPPSPRFFRDGPHPLREKTRFRFEIPAPALVSADVYDVGGRRVASLVRGPRKAGSHRLEWNGTNDRGERLAGGVYFVRFRTAGFTATEKLVLVR